MWVGVGGGEPTHLEGTMTLGKDSIWMGDLSHRGSKYPTPHLGQSLLSLERDHLLLWSWEDSK